MTNVPQRGCGCTRFVYSVVGVVSMGAVRGLLAALMVGPLLAACGTDRVESPLNFPDRDHPLPRELADSGAAGRSLQCDHEYYWGGTRDGERFPITESPRTALRAYAEHRFATIPTSGFEIARKDDDRALFTYDVGGETKAAVMVAAQVPGRWTMKVYAQCDPAEFHPSTDADAGFEIWTDRDGNRVPIHELTISRGLPAHCGWESASVIGFDMRSEQWTDYVRDPEGVLTDWTRGSYAADVELPADAEDSGYRIDDWQLWYAADRSAVYIVTPDDVERWPRAKGPVGCI